MDILTHRGLAHETGPNTRSAFSNALQAGYGIEVDLRITADDKFVVAHDPSLVTGKCGAVTVKDRNLRELRDLYGPGTHNEAQESLPSLRDIIEDYVACDAEETIALHLKDIRTDGIERQLIDTLDKLDEEYPHVDLFDTVFVFDVLASNARTLRSIAPDLSVALSVGEPDHFPARDHPTVYRYDDIRDLSCWDTVWADEWCGNHYSDSLFDAFATDDRDVYTVSPELHRTTSPQHPNCEDPQTVWPRLVGDRVDGICTDLPFELGNFIDSARE